MQSFPYRFRPFECDIYGTASPTMLMCATTWSTMLKANAEGTTAELMMEKLGAVWMLARISLEQTLPVYENDATELEVTSRSIDKVSYTRRVRVMRDGVECAVANLSFIAVNSEHRNIIRPSTLEAACPSLVPPIELPPLRKLMMPKDAAAAGSHHVSYTECDSNGHLHSAKYANIICEHIGYWKGEQRLMKFIQIDFNAECKPGEEIELLTSVKDGMSYMRGVHPTGVPAFTACWKMED